MAALPMPAGLRIARAQFRLQANTTSFASPLDNSVQTVELPGALWSATYEVVPMTADQAAEIQAFLVALMGRAGRFLGFDPARTSPRGSYNAGLDTPLVMGTGQSGATLATALFCGAGLDAHIQAAAQDNEHGVAAAALCGPAARQLIDGALRDEAPATPE